MLFAYGYNTPCVDVLGCRFFSGSSLRSLSVEDNVRERPLPVNNPHKPSEGYLQVRRKFNQFVPNNQRKCNLFYQQAHIKGDLV